MYIQLNTFVDIHHPKYGHGSFEEQVCATVFPGCFFCLSWLPAQLKFEPARLIEEDRYIVEGRLAVTL